MQWQLVLEREGQGFSSHIPSLDFSPLEAYRPPSKALVMKGLQRLPEVLEDAPSIVSDVASKQMRREIQPTPSARAKKLALQEHLLPSCNPVLVLVFFFELCFPPVPQH